MLLSIIIPMFNAQDTIERCLFSILKQQEEAVSYQIIVIDDVSEDNGPNLVTQIANQYPQVQLVKLKQRGGAGHARNCGILHAHGEYLWFVDSDDYLTPKSITLISNRLSGLHDKPDIIWFAYRYHNVQDDSISNGMDQRDMTIIAQHSVFNQPFSISEHPQLYACIAYPWNKLFKKTLIDCHHIQFSTTIVHNDIFFNYVSLFYAQQIVMIGDLLYTHVINRNSQASNILDTRRLDLLTIFGQLEHFFTDVKFDVQCMVYYLVFKIDLLIWIISRLTEPSILRVFCNYLQRTLQTIQPYLLQQLLHIDTLTSVIVKNIVQRDPLINNRVYGQHNILLSLVIPIDHTTPTSPLQSTNNQLSQLVHQNLNPNLYEVLIVDHTSPAIGYELVSKIDINQCNCRLIRSLNHDLRFERMLFANDIKQLKGAYVIFLDNTDNITAKTCLELLLTAVHHHSDVLILIDHLDSKVQHNAQNNTIPPPSDNDTLLNYPPGLYHKLYSRSFLTGNTTFDKPELNFFMDDVAWHWYTVLSTKPVFIYQQIYQKTQHAQPGKSSAASHCDQNYHDITTARNIANFLVQYNLTNDRKYLESFAQWYLTNITPERLTAMPPSQLRSFMNQMRNHCRYLNIKHLKARYRGWLPYYHRLMLRGHYNVAHIVYNLGLWLEKASKALFTPPLPNSK